MTLVRYAHKHRWIKEADQTLRESYGEKKAYRIRSTEKRINDTDVTFNIEPLNEENLSWFIPLYEKEIKKKQNSKVHDVRETTLNKEVDYSYFILTQTESGIRTGGAIFSMREDMLSVAYRINPKKWLRANLPASPSIYTEYLLTKYAKENGKKIISHGRDRNPYGQNANIGLSLFKLSIGCHAVLPEEYEIEELEIENLTEDTFVLEFPEEGDRITKAHLVTSEENFPKYEALTKYPERLEVMTHLNY